MAYRGMQREMAPPIKWEFAEPLQLATSRQAKTTFTMLLRIFSFFLLVTAYCLANGEQICHNNDCFPRIFVPTEEFQVVKEGQEIPRGKSFMKHNSQ
jgi:hypothetical protein